MSFICLRSHINSFGLMLIPNIFITRPLREGDGIPSMVFMMIMGFGLLAGKIWSALLPIFFENLFATSSPLVFDEVLYGLSRVVSDDMNAALDADPIDDEIERALFQMHPNNALGPNGFYALFFQKFWDILGNDVVYLVKKWWRGLIDLSHLNQMCISLVPKSHEHKVLGDFCPISCCNVIYKVISKVLANRLKPFLSSTVSPNLSVFIPNRSIIDNALMAFEAFLSMKRNKNRSQSFSALKLDMSKVYDRVSGVFLKR